jgi:cytochrome P450
MAYMFLLLCENPGIQERLSADHDLIPAALEEMMRYVTPVRSMARTVMADVEINGCPMRRGDRLHMNHVAGNHDPEVFENPEEIIIDRRPNRHLGFGMGPHMCLGIHMARAEMRVAFEETLSRMKSLRLADPDLVKEEPGATWSIASLPIEFDRVEAV